MGTSLYAPNKQADLKSRLKYIEGRQGFAWLANQRLLHEAKLKELAGDNTEPRLHEPDNSSYFSGGTVMMTWVLAWVLWMVVSLITGNFADGIIAGIGTLIGGWFIAPASRFAVRKVRLGHATETVQLALERYDMVFVSSELLQRWYTVAQEWGVGRDDADDRTFLNNERMTFHELEPFVTLLESGKLNDRLRRQMEERVALTLKKLAYRRLQQLGQACTARVDSQIDQINGVNAFAAALLEARGEIVD